MSLTLQPGNYFTVVRQIANWTDTDTNYVKAVIRNAFTDDIIDTLQLTDKGSQRFKKDWIVPRDASGQGFYVSIVTSVYTDSGYTTKNANYGDEENTYLVQERVFTPRGGGSLGISDIRRVLKEELAKLDIPEGIDYARIPQPKDIMDRTDELIQVIKSNKPETPQPTDLSSVLSAIEEAKQAIDAKEVTPETDLEPLLQRVQEASEENGTDFSEIKDNLVAFEERMITKVEETIKKAMDETEFTSTFSTRAQPKKPTAQQDQRQPFDIRSLAQ